MRESNGWEGRVRKELASDGRGERGRMIVEEEKWEGGKDASEEREEERKTGY